jgi:hypothetical protein
MEKDFGSVIQEIVIDMKVTIRTIKSGDMGSLHGLVATIIAGITKRMCVMATVRCTGSMELTIKVSGFMEFSTVKVIDF